VLDCKHGLVVGLGILDASETLHNDLLDQTEYVTSMLHGSVRRSG
jgi:hypothetical protein